MQVPVQALPTIPLLSGAKNNRNITGHVWGSLRVSCLLPSVCLNLDEQAEEKIASLQGSRRHRLPAQCVRREVRQEACGGKGGVRASACVSCA